MTTFIAKWILIYSVLYATYQRKNCPYLDVVTYIENVLGGTAVADEPVSIKERENTFRHGEGARTHKKNIKRDYKTTVMRPSNFLLTLQRGNLHGHDDSFSPLQTLFFYCNWCSSYMRELIARYNQSHPFLLVHKYSRAQGGVWCGWLSRNETERTQRNYIIFFLSTVPRSLDELIRALATNGKSSAFVYVKHPTGPHHILLQGSWMNKAKTTNLLI